MTRVGITVGEPCGIGPEIILRSLANLHPAEQITIFGNQALLERTAKHLGLSSILDHSHVQIVSVLPDVQDPKDMKGRAKATLQALDLAVEAIGAKKIDCLVTAPLDKSVVRSILPTFTGHTGYLAQKAGVHKTLMLLDNTEIRVLLLTEHIPLREVHCAVTSLEMVSSVELAVASLVKHYGMKNPHIAVVGLNPHAGEIVEDPEEKTVIEPAVTILQKKDFKIEGPFPADSFFSIARKGGWDLIVSLYHDQGLIAAKYPGIDKVVNITLGLPYIRVSPGHGTAYDLVGKGTADTRSFERAFRMASEGKLTV